MDGSTIDYLLDTEAFSSQADPPSGILYIEDFDVDLNANCSPVKGSTPEPRQTEPVLTLADIDAAREAGRLAGPQAALDDAHLLQTQIQAAAIQNLADALDTTRAVFHKTVRKAAEDGVCVILAILHAAIPALMEKHAAAETEAVFRALLAGISLEPELRMRAHPEATVRLSELVASLLPDHTGTVSVTADSAMAPGEVQITWRDGSAVRDTVHIWTDIREALVPLSLPTIKELCREFGC